MFILVVAILGSMWGFLESFLFVFLRNLKAPTYMLGKTPMLQILAITVGRPRCYINYQIY